MSFLLWFGILAISSSGLFGLSTFSPRDLGVAIPLFLIGCACYLKSFTSLHQKRFAWASGSLYLVAGIALAGILTPLAFFAMASSHRVDCLIRPLTLLANVCGMDAAASQGEILVQSTTQLVPFSANWEKLGALPSLWFLCIALPLLMSKHEHWRRDSLKLLAIVSLYAPLRFVGLMTLAMVESSPSFTNFTRWDSVDIFASPQVQALSFLPLALFGTLLIPWPPISPPLIRWRSLGTRKHVVAIALVIVTAVVATTHSQLRSVGAPKAGRVLFDEFHGSKWAKASRPLDKEWYGRQSTYNYASLYALLNRYFFVDLNSTSHYSKALLQNYDILIIKTVDRPFTPDEIDAIEAFVFEGGGLWLIGDHTDILGMATYTNPLSERFGIRFNRDAVNRLHDRQFMTYRPPSLFRHPLFAHVNEISLMTSCSLTVPWNEENAMLGTNVFSDHIDYSAPSFFGNVTPDLNEDFGIISTAAAVRHGKGRVVAFADSTILSSFALAYGDRPEFVLGTMGYLNHRNSDNPLTQFLAVATILLCLCTTAAALIHARSQRATLVPSAFIATALGMLGSSNLIQCSQQERHPLPDPKEKTTEIAFVQDRCSFHLPPAMIVPQVPPERSFDVFYLWMQRLGHAPRVRSFADALHAEAVVFINPSKELSNQELIELHEYVAKGGKLLVMDSIWNDSSTANALLTPFNLGVRSRLLSEHSTYTSEPIQSGELANCADGSCATGDIKRPSPAIEVLQFDDVSAEPLSGPCSIPSLEVLGGISLFETKDGRSLGTVTAYGRGRVIVLVDSTTFSRSAMGTPIDEIRENDPRRALFDFQYRLIDEYLLSEPSSNLASAAPAAQKAGSS